MEVVTKLFNVVEPDVAVFGMKDYQQLQVIKTFTEELNFDIEIIGGPIQREPDGLAMSRLDALTVKITDAVAMHCCMKLFGLDAM